MLGVGQEPRGRARPRKGCRHAPHRPREAVTGYGSPGPPGAAELSQTQEGSLVPLPPQLRSDAGALTGLGDLLSGVTSAHLSLHAATLGPAGTAASGRELPGGPGQTHTELGASWAPWGVFLEGLLCVSGEWEAGDWLCPPSLPRRDRLALAAGFSGCWVSCSRSLGSDFPRRPPTSASHKGPRGPHPTTHSSETTMHVTGCVPCRHLGAWTSLNFAVPHLEKGHSRPQEQDWGAGSKRHGHFRGAAGSGRAGLKPKSPL